MQYQRLPDYPLPPGCDYITGGTATPVIDTGIDVDYRTCKQGRIYLSEPTVAEFARMFGWHPPAEVNALVADLAAAEAKIADLENRNEKLERLAGAVKAAFPAFFDEPEHPGTATFVPAPEPSTPEPITERQQNLASVPDDAEFPFHKGAGWFVLSNGEKIRGADDAHKAEAALRRGVAA